MSIKLGNDVCSLITDNIDTHAWDASCETVNDKCRYGIVTAKELIMYDVSKLVLSTVWRLVINNVKRKSINQ
jgi:hypothetical protein